MFHTITWSYDDQGGMTRVEIAGDLIQFRTSSLKIHPLGQEQNLLGHILGRTTRGQRLLMQKIDDGVDAFLAKKGKGKAILYPTLNSEGFRF